MLKYLSIIIVVMTLAIIIKPKQAHSVTETETPMCAIGSNDDTNCVLDPTDCSRGIDESNQEECGQ